MTLDNNCFSFLEIGLAAGTEGGQDRRRRRRWDGGPEGSSRRGAEDCPGCGGGRSCPSSLASPEPPAALHGRPAASRAPARNRSSLTVVTRGGEILKFPAMNSLHFFFCLDHSFWQGQRATVAWGFKCTFLDCSRETPDWRANSTGTGRREPKPESPHPPHLEPFSRWGTSRDYLPCASASGRASHTRPLRHVPVLPPSSPPLLQRVPPRQRPGGPTGY
ncbi:hypothetical protein mRhiFer1_008006 [Rhinolophus ferrumequinum]|uniref:Uncharacterized protein n=1 Tax=Rhinolophus ferrumequinum TaxID=59479 RepID=A0A7J7WQN7_RHIFE|nr:hypothetical protein mRhiFer1_008006 [Rhinolophus ferrumequinum]